MLVERTQKFKLMTFSSRGFLLAPANTWDHWSPMLRTRVWGWAATPQSLLLPTLSPAPGPENWGPHPKVRGGHQGHTCWQARLPPMQVIRTAHQPPWRRETPPGGERPPQWAHRPGPPSSQQSWSSNSPNSCEHPAAAGLLKYDVQPSELTSLGWWVHRYLGRSPRHSHRVELLEEPHATG